MVASFFSLRYGTAAITLPFTSVNTDGWSVEYTSTPASLNPLDLITISQPGFDDAGSVTNVSETLTATQRVRLAFPDQATLASNRVALSGELLASTIISGVTNNSTLVAPTPIVNWTMLSRHLVGNTVRVGVTGNHWAARNGRPFRCVVFTATDGTTTVSTTVTAMSVSTTCAGDQHAVLAYETDLDISSLANPANVTVNAKVYPWIGTSASVADSSTGSGHREFSPRVFRRDTAKSANPNVVYVAAGGVDATGYVGTDATAAAASPCLTLTGAINRARAVLGTTSGALDNLEVRLTEGTWSLSANPTANVTDFLVTITRAPGAAKANTILQFGTSNFHPNVTYLRYKGLTINRTGAFYTYAGNVGFCVYEDNVWSSISSTGALTSSTTLHFWYGNVFNAAIGQMLAAASPSHAMIRGVNSTVSTGNFHGFLMIGSKLRGGVHAGGTYSENNSIIQFNSFRGASSGNAVVDLQASIVGFSFSQNLVEVGHTVTSTPAIRPSSDSALNSLTHVLFVNNTVASGHYQVGRFNAFYDETQGTYRVHRFCRIRNSVIGGLYIKGDVFVGENGNGSPNPTDAPFHIGNWAQMYAVGWRNNQTLFVNVGSNGIGGNQGLAYAGVGSSIATSQTTPAISLADNVNFTSWRATTTNSGSGAAIAGALDGDYTLPTGSALLGRVVSADEVFPYDLVGVSRSRGAIGAYA